MRTDRITRALVVLGATTLHLPAAIAPAVHDYRAGDSDWHRTVMGLALLGLLTDLVCAGAMLSVFARNCTAPRSVRALVVDAWTMLLGAALLLVESMLMLGP